MANHASDRDITDPLSFMKLDMAENFLNGKHLKLCNKYIMQLFNGDINKLLISLGPRHGKSSIATYALAYYALTHAYKQEEAMVISYGKTLAEGICQTSRELVEYYGDIELDDTWNRKDSWQFKRPGKFRAHAHGIDGPITGKGADFLILDDTIKNADEALNETKMQKLLNWYDAVLLSRLHKNAKVLSIGTRWSESDLIQKQLDEGDWTVINLPTICNNPDTDILKRQYGEVLWPEHLDLEFIEDKRKRMSDFWFECIYQGNPTSPTGLMMTPDEDLNWLPHPPYPRAEMFRILYCDPAFTSGSVNPRADYSVITCLDYHAPSRMYFLRKQTAGQWDTQELKRNMIKEYNYTNPDIFKMEQVSASIIMIEDLQMLGLPIMGYKPGGERKEKRMMNLVPIISNGQLTLDYPKDKFEPLIKQLKGYNGPSAPNTTGHDDYIDSLSAAIINNIGGNPFTNPGPSSFREGSLGYNKAKYNISAFGLNRGR